MSQHDASQDAFSDYAFNQIDPKVRSTFTQEQSAAILNVFRSFRSRNRHTLDIRGIIPFFFVRFYFVILLGRDRRISTQILEEDRRRKGWVIGGIFFYFLILTPMMFVFFVFLYLLKSAMGIDIFSNRHMLDFLSF